MLISKSEENSTIATFVISRLLEKGELKKACQLFPNAPLTHYCAINLTTLDVKCIPAGTHGLDYFPLGEIMINGQMIMTEAKNNAFKEAKSKFQYPTLINDDLTPLNISPSLKNNFVKHYNKLFVEDAMFNTLSDFGFSTALKQNTTERVYDEVVGAMKEAIHLLIANKSTATILCHHLCEDYEFQAKEETH